MSAVERLRQKLAQAQEKERQEQKINDLQEQFSQTWNQLQSLMNSISENDIRHSASYEQKIADIEDRIEELDQKIEHVKEELKELKRVGEDIQNLTDISEAKKTNLVSEAEDAVSKKETELEILDAERKQAVNELSESEKVLSRAVEVESEFSDDGVNTLQDKLQAIRAEMSDIDPKYVPHEVETAEDLERKIEKLEEEKAQIEEGITLNGINLYDSSRVKELWEIEQELYFISNPDSDLTRLEGLSREAFNPVYRDTKPKSTDEFILDRLASDKGYKLSTGTINTIIEWFERESDNLGLSDDELEAFKQDPSYEKYLDIVREEHETVKIRPIRIEADKLKALRSMREKFTELLTPNSSPGYSNSKDNFPYREIGSDYDAYSSFVWDPIAGKDIRSLIDENRVLFSSFMDRLKELHESHLEYNKRKKEEYQVNIEAKAKGIAVNYVAGVEESISTEVNEKKGGIDANLKLLREKLARIPELKKELEKAKKAFEESEADHRKKLEVAEKAVADANKKCKAAKNKWFGVKKAMKEADKEVGNAIETLEKLKSDRIKQEEKLEFLEGELRGLPYEIQRLKSDIINLIDLGKHDIGQLIESKKYQGNRDLQMILDNNFQSEIRNNNTIKTYLRGLDISSGLNNLSEKIESEFDEKRSELDEIISINQAMNEVNDLAR